MSVEVRSHRYVFSHGKHPTGRGWWMFEAKPGEIVHQGSGLFSEVKRAAIAAARAAGIHVIHVCP